MNKFIPLCVPNFEGNEKKYVDEAVEQGWVSTGGAYISELEAKMADFLKVEEVAACQSGTSAIHLALIEAGVEPGDMVIVPTLTFIAAVNPVRYQFATPIFMDCDDSLCMDSQKLKTFCEEECTFNGANLIYNATGNKIKALIVVHVFGNLADMEQIIDICGKYHIRVIEDATEALGSRFVSGRYAGKYAGTIGDFGAFSFNGNKIITTGGGGAVTASNLNAVKHMRYLSTQSKDDPHYYIHNEIGYNYRMTNVQAAIGVAQMEELPEFILRKQNNYEKYKKIFEDYSLGKILEFRPGVDSNKWFYSLKVDKTKVNVSMRDIITSLENLGVGSRAIWGLIHEQMPYKDSPKYKIEKAKYYSSCILNIPSSTNLKDEDIHYVAKTIMKVLEEYSNEQ